jgi:hypothetical protein
LNWGGGSVILQGHPLRKILIIAIGSLLLGTEKLEDASQIPVTAVADGKGELARNVQGTRANLSGGDMQVGDDRSR